MRTRLSFSTRVCLLVTALLLAGSITLISAPRTASINDSSKPAQRATKEQTHYDTEKSMSVEDFPQNFQIDSLSNGYFFPFQYVMDGSHCFLAGENEIKFGDLANGASTTFSKIYSTTRTINGLLFQDGLLFVSELSSPLEFSDTLNVLDVQDPMHPTLVAQDTITRNESGSMYLFDNRLFVSYSNQMTVYDISDLDSLISLGTVTFSGLDPVVFAQDSNLYFHSHTNTDLYLYTLSDSITAELDTTIHTVNTISTAGTYRNYFFLVCGGWNDDHYTLDTYDISCIDSLKWLSTLQIVPGVSSLYVSDSTAYLCGRYTDVVNLSDPMIPVITCTLTTTFPTYFPQVTDDRLYTFGDILYAYEITDPQSPTELFAVSYPVMPAAITHYSGYIYLFDDYRGVFTIGKNDTGGLRFENLTLIALREHATWILRMKAANSVLYAAHWNSNIPGWEQRGITTISISDPVAPHAIGQIQVYGLKDFLINENFLYTPGQPENGDEIQLLVIDISDPHLPVLFKKIDIPIIMNTYYDEIAQWSHRLVIRNYCKTIVFDIGDPENPEFLFENTIFFESNAKMALGDHLFVADREYISATDAWDVNLYTYDIGDDGVITLNTSTTILSGVDAVDYVTHFALHEYTLLAAVSEHGLFVVDASDPYSLHVVDQYPMNIDLNTIEDSDDSCFYAARGDKFYIVKYPAILSGITEAPITAQPQDFSIRSIYPNPFNNSARIKINVAQKGHLRVEVYNLMGQRVTTLYDGTAEAGVLILPFSAFNHASGVYFVRSSLEGYDTRTRRITLLR
jgi:hypothetical protein